MANYTFDEFVNALEIQFANLGTYLTELGATSADVTKRGKWLDNLKGVDNYCELADTAKKTAFANKNSLMTGKAGDPVSPFAPISTGTWADPSQGVGYYETFLEDNRRWMASPGCTPEIITACALKKTTEAPDAATVQPTAEVDPAQAGGYLGTVVVKNRGEADMFEVFARVVGTTQWVSLGRFSKRSADVTWPSGDGNAVMLDFRVQLLKGDQPYGQMSAIVSATLNP